MLFTVYLLYVINEGTSLTEWGHEMLLVERLKAVKLEQHHLNVSSLFACFRFFLYQQVQVQVRALLN